MFRLLFENEPTRRDHSTRRDPSRPEPRSNDQPKFRRDTEKEDPFSDFFVSDKLLTTRGPLSFFEFPSPLNVFPLTVNSEGECKASVSLSVRFGFQLGSPFIRDGCGLVPFLPLLSVSTFV